VFLAGEGTLDELFATGAPFTVLAWVLAHGSSDAIPVTAQARSIVRIEQVAGSSARGQGS
jgi:hypothetical protein